MKTLPYYTSSWEITKPVTSLFEMLQNVDVLFKDLFENVPNYPPVNVVKEDEGEYLIEMALAGFKPETIKVALEKNKLVISSNNVEVEEDDRKYLKRGIALRQFTREFFLPEYSEVGEVTFSNGMLNIPVKIEVPEEKKPRQLSIKKV